MTKLSSMLFEGISSKYSRYMERKRLFLLGEVSWTYDNEFKLYANNLLKRMLHRDNINAAYKRVKSISRFKNKVREISHIL